MSNVSKVLANGVLYDIEDDPARDNISELAQSIIALSNEVELTGDKIASSYNYEKLEDISFLSSENVGKYVKVDDTIGTSSWYSHTDYILIPTGAIAVECGNKTSNGSGTIYRCNPNIVFYDENKTKLFANANSSDDIAIYTIPTKARYIRVNQPAPAAPVKTSLIRFVFPDINGFVGKHKVTFTSTASQITTLIYLEANTPYTIVCNTEIADGHVNVMVNNHSSLFKSIYTKGSIEFTPKDSGYMALYNVSGTVTGAFEVEVYKSSGLMAKMRREPTVYEVGPAKAYSSLTALLLALKDDDSEKTIYIDGGDYDIFQEYTDLGLLTGDPPSDIGSGYFDYNVWIPTNTHIIGRGIVRLLWQPTSSQISQGWSKTISPVNVAGSMTLENVEIYCGNGRYCIHDDPLGNLAYNRATKHYKNVRCYKTAKDSGYGYTSVIGFGLDSNMTYQFDNCLFKSEISGACFYMHNRTLYPNSDSCSPTLLVNNCVIDTDANAPGVSLGNGASASGKNIHIKITFTDCYIMGSFKVGDETNKSQGTIPNTWDVTLVNCNDINVEIASTVNPYPAKIYSYSTDLKSAIGNLNNLDTDVKTDLVSAINEAATSGGGTGMSAAFKRLFLDWLEEIPWINESPTGQTWINRFSAILFPPPTAIIASYDNTGIVLDVETVDALKRYLTVTALYEDGSREVVLNDDVEITGTITAGDQTFTATYQNLTATFTATITTPTNEIFTTGIAKRETGGTITDIEGGYLFTATADNVWTLYTYISGNSNRPMVKNMWNHTIRAVYDIELTGGSALIRIPVTSSSGYAGYMRYFEKRVANGAGHFVGSVDAVVNNDGFTYGDTTLVSTSTNKVGAEGRFVAPTGNTATFKIHYYDLGVLA